MSPEVPQPTPRDGFLARLRTADPRWFWLALFATAALVVTLVLMVMMLISNSLVGTEKGELVILSGRDESAGGQRQKLINEWNERHPDNPARIIELPVWLISSETRWSSTRSPGKAPSIFTTLT